MKAKLLLLCSLFVSSFALPRVHAAGDYVESVAYQQNPTHTGAVHMGTFAPPLTSLWSKNYAGDVSYPIVTSGKVIFTVAKTSGYGTLMYGLNADTGTTAWGPIDLGGSYFFSALTYEGGKVYVLDYNGLLRAYYASSGVLVWARQLTGQYAFTAPPTAFNGTVYAGGAGSGGTLYAVNEIQGNILWTASVANGDKRSPTVTSDGVYVAYAGNQAYKFDPKTGKLLWHHDSGISGGGGKTTVFYGNSLLTRDFDGNLIMNGKNGAVTGSYSANPIVAISGNRAFALSGNTLEGINAKSGAVEWSFVGDNHLITAPFVVNDTVYIGSTSGNLYGLDVTDGTTIWTANMGTAFAWPDEQNATILTGFAAGGNRLFIVSGTRLTAFGQ